MTSSTKRSLSGRSGSPVGRLLCAVLLLALGLGCGRAPEQAAAVWTCPMHPEVIADAPGSCPICSMDLVEKKPVAEVWTCPMHPEVVADAPGSCPICHMDLVKQEPAATSGGVGAVDAAGVATVEARAASVARTVRAVGRVVADERRSSKVDARFPGWIAELDADFVGKRLAKGQRVALLDSPELYAAESDYLVAREAARRLLASELPEVRRGADDLVLAARRRLELANIPDIRITELERTRVARRTIEIVTPIAGTVVEKLVVRGQRIEAGTPLVALLDLSRVWIEADLVESDAAVARVGQEATLRLPYDPTFTATAQVSFLSPELSAESRTLRARFELANPGELLKPGMLVDVELATGELAGVAVPDAAVLATGERTLVFVADADGRFAARAVELAGRSGGTSYLSSGLAAGERVAAEASFLVDAESRLRGVLLDGAVASPPATGHEGHQ